MHTHSEHERNDELAKANEDHAKDIERHSRRQKILFLNLSEDLGRPPTNP